MNKKTSRNERGQALVLIMMLMPVLIGMVGFSVDYALVSAERGDMQAAADAAALAAAQDLENPNDAVGLAKDYAEKNGFADADGFTVSVVTSYGGDPDLIEVTISGSIETTFIRVLGVDSADISARAVAEGTSGSAGAAGYALIALNETTCRALDKSGSGDVVITNGGGIMVNSSCDNTSNGAINRTGGGDIDAARIDYYQDGTVTESGSGSLIPEASPVGSRINDPLAGLPVPDLAAIGISPDSGGTAADPAVLDVGSDPLRVLRPGVYYGGIKIASGGDIVFEPGTYVIAGGGLAVGGSGAVTGSGVFFYNTNDPYADQGGPGSPARCQEVNLRGSGDVALTPPTSGPYENILFWQDVNCDKPFKFEGGSGASVGVIYLPGARFDLAGSGPVGSVQVIADTIDIAGSGTLTITFQDFLDLPPISPVFKLIE